MMKLFDQFIINPVTISSLLWIVLLVSYNFINHGLYPLSDKFYVALLFWYIPFVLFFFIAALLQTPSIHYISNRPLSFLYSEGLMWFFMGCLSLFIVFKIRDVQQFSPTDFYRAIRQLALARSRGEIENVPSYMIHLNRICQFSYVLMFVHINKGVKLKGRYLFYGLVAIYILLGANKFIIAKVLSALFVLRAYKGNLHFAKILFLLILMFFFFYASELLRRGSFSEDLGLLNFVYIYVLTPMPAFDSYILHSSSSMLFTSFDPGHHIFSNVLGMSEVNPDYFDQENSVFVPLPTNVFTMMSSYYVDYKWLGLLFGGALYGLFFGYIYLKSFFSEPFRILYASLFFVLVFQSFFDYLLTQQSRYNISLVIVLFLIFYPFSLYVEKQQK